MQFSSFAHILQWENRLHLCCVATLIGLILLVATPTIPHSPTQHIFADMRNFLGVPNTLNVLTTYPYLFFGVPGLVFCLSGSCFGISLKGELWGWVLFYAGTAAAAFGSAYYHLKPDDDRIIWERLPMMISTISLLSNLVIERLDERVGISCLISLLMLVFVSATIERTFDDLRLCIIFHFIPCIAIPVLVFLFPPKYTHSTYWFWATGFYLLSRFESVADMKVYSIDRYIISGHSLEHLCLAMVAFILTVMLWLRSIKISRDY
ncbi:uncharacterized protein LOC110033745 isoform X1 [Phalaenopsis equestris]|uniref:uncharacterized protein LOC110033745 isoform X1 n=2 Tax=Phalaenopsis equestris TaxID=78828 RepID=UPI0009E49F7F|nr:uncharacterized protein LOC110033745 isoform X1 [Phalaenopsis equestris]XP_020593473.1 uncharacterized protein LOC110033745 isoform X1 [Phalaenopsis equestris]XP_020593474.1 uncharacterized protein LOC110033745 isoform X1 [Phalaenopsis equestris]XP_020593475.1 uncharacterized protein LOC110033745 isoform X1 [Phalaenopsis equestris]XP_020593476.1 uncharacterized protein LOC110033745 isoform X1 [Phalaenopsis equestris]XP_020593477.1 uncharacterized protein LOC110033745 isoform X1 [Phalaenopsi